MESPFLHPRTIDRRINDGGRQLHSCDDRVHGRCDRRRDYGYARGQLEREERKRDDKNSCSIKERMLFLSPVGWMESKIVAHEGQSVSR